MLQHLFGDVSSPWATGFGALLSGISQIVLVISGAVGLIIRHRHTIRQDNSAQEASLKAARDAAKRLDKMYTERISQYEKTIERMDHAHEMQQNLYEERLNTLQALNTKLMNQILRGH